MEDGEIDYVARRKRLKIILGALLGATTVGRIGYLTGGADALRRGERFSTGSLLGGTGGFVLGGLGGALGAHINNRSREWAGLDPMGSPVTVPKV